MQTAAANISLVLTDSSSLDRLADSQTAISQGGFYQLIAGLIRGVYKKDVFRELGDRLVLLAEHAHAFRQMDALEHLSRMLLSSHLPREYESIGRYYKAVCTQRFGRGDVGRAVRMLESVEDSAPPKYRVRTTISLAANLRHQGDNQTALSLYCEGGRFASRDNLNDPYSIITAQRMFAVIAGEAGNHRGALALLENLFQLAHATRSSQPHVYYDYMNSLAVELCEVGRLEEAKNVSQIVLASPFAPAYPEWRETREEIELRGRRESRSMVAFGQRASEAEDFVRLALPADSSETVPNRMVCQLGNVVSLPVREPDRRDSADPAEAIPGDQKRSARVFSLEEHKKKKKMSEKPNDEPEGKHTQAELNKMTTSELLVAIMNRISNDVGDHALARVLSLLDEIALENKEKT
jgi:hypothetical protein